MITKQRIKRLIHNTNQFLNRPIAVIIVLLLLFAYFAWGNFQFQNQNRTLLENTNKTTQNTNDIVHGQTDILNAIKKLANDTKLDSNEKTNIIICMLQVPVALRTDNLQDQCRKQVESQLSNEVAAPTVTASPTKPPAPAVVTTPAAKTPTPSPPTTTPTPSPTVPPVFERLFSCHIDILGLHITCP